MTVMTDGTGGAHTAAPPTPHVDAIVAVLAPKVWRLIRAGRLPDALVLLEAELEDFERAWRREYVGIATTPVQATIQPPVPGACISMDHAGLDCAAALAEGLLPEDVPFCPPCSAKQLALQPSPAMAMDSGKIVTIVTTAGTARVRKAG